ncbi:MAG: hypothetical protein WCP89_03500 [archaeon]
MATQENQEIIKKVKEKKEFSQLPDSLIERVLKKEKADIKETRALLRKYFTVFLTNKLLSGKLTSEEMLKKHISSQNRNYTELYGEILRGNETIIDIGAGVNGFSYSFMPKNTRYVAIEATGQLVDLMNVYFEKEKFSAEAIHSDIFNLEEIIGIIKKHKKPRTILLFNVIDALEFFEKDYSKKLLAGIKEHLGPGERIVISFPTQSLTGKTKFHTTRKWLLDFLGENFSIINTFEENGEKFIILEKK